MIATSTRVDIGWEALIAILALIFSLSVLGIIAMTRRLRNHHLRVGFFVERGDELSGPDESWLDPETTAELPVTKEEK